MRGPSPTGDSLVNEFMSLNRRRLFGAPPLGVAELARWQRLRRELSERYGDRLQGLLSAVERRAHFRFPTHLEVRFDTGGGLRSACLANISEGGMFVALEEPLAVGTPLRLTLCAPQGSIALPGQVAWTRRAGGPDGPAGMGVRFVALSDEQRDLVAAVVEGVTPEGGRA